MGSKTVKSVEKAMAILEFLAQEGGKAHLNHIAHKMGMGKSSAHNIISTLVDLGYIQRKSGSTAYFLGSRVMNLSRVAGDDQRLKEYFEPILKVISNRWKETVYLAVPAGDGIKYLDQIFSLYTDEAPYPEGSRETLERSAIGLIFLAMMPGVFERVQKTRQKPLGDDVQALLADIRHKGYALDCGQYKKGLNCVAIPAYYYGEVRACISMSGSAKRLSRAKLSELAWKMMQFSQSPGL